MSATIVIECPNCATKYNVKETAILPHGRTVHCNQCQNKWRILPPVASASQWEERFKPDPMMDRTETAYEEGHDHHEVVEPHSDEAAASAAPASDEYDDARAAAIRAQRAAPDSSSNVIAATPKVVSEPDEGAKARKASLGLLAASLAVLAGGIVGMHGRIESLWPASARFYQVAGLDKASLPGQGLDLQNVHAALTNEAGGQVLTIEAQVVNTKKTVTPVPTLVATLIPAEIPGQGPVPSRQWTFDAGTQSLPPQATASVKASFDGANTENGKILLTFSADNSVVVK